MQLRNKLRGKKAQELGSTLVTLQETDPISKVINCFKTMGIGRVPIVDDKGRLSGICSIEDILYKFHLAPQSGRKGSNKGKAHGATAAQELSSRGKLPAGNLMTANVWTIRPGDSLTKAVDFLIEAGIGSVLVVSNNKPTGIVTIKDLLRLVQ